MRLRALDVLAGTNTQLLAAACDSGTLTDDADALAHELGPTAVVRSLRGRKMRTLDALFDEVSATLQFPYYFGENWNAFHECMRDLSWLPAATYVFVLHDAQQVLADADAVELDILVDSLLTAASDAGPRTVRLLLHCYPGEEDALARKYLTRSTGAPSPVQLVWVTVDDD